MEKSQAQVVLASKSPRRAELLQQIHISFVCDAADIDETVLAGETAADYVQRLARQKAQAIWCKREAEQQPLLPVLGSDTAVVIGEEILGKPNNKADAIVMLKKLSGKAHQVLTAVSVISQSKTLTALSTTTVNFKAVSALEIENYVDSGEPNDKAGAYGIQGFAAVFIEKIEGSYSGVMGLPLAETYQLLQEVKGC